MPDLARRWQTLAFCLLLVALVAGSSPRRVGDGGQYLATSINVANLRGPWLTVSDIKRLEQENTADLELNDWNLTKATRSTQQYPGTRDFEHFWFYPALAAPFVAMTQLTGIHPQYGFAFLNSLMLVGAFWLALPRLGGLLTWLVFAGPSVWWVDKAHTELFTLSLLTVAVLVIEEAPAWAFVAAGAAAAQNLPIVVFIPIGVGVLFIRRPALRRSRGVWLGAAAGMVLALIPVVYYEMRYGTPSILLEVARRVRPGVADLLAVPFDTNIGVAANAPALALVVLLAAIAVSRWPRRWLAPDMLVCTLVLPAFLISFAQTKNFHHGGTPAMSRYGMWLIPLALPLLRSFSGIATKHWMRPVALMTIPSVIISVFVFHPKAAENSREPTWLADSLWSRLPSVDNPLPEIFAEVLSHQDDEWSLPQATVGCTKVLFGFRSAPEGTWPIPCFPAVPPARCMSPGTLCYANRTQKGYDFVVRPSEGYRYTGERIWRPEAEPIVRKIMEELDWTTLRAPRDPSGSAVGGVVNVEGVWSFEAADRLLVVLAGIRADATLMLNLSRNMTGALIDPNTGARIREVSVSGSSGGPTDVPVPAEVQLQLLVLRQVAKSD